MGLIQPAKDTVIMAYALYLERKNKNFYFKLFINVPFFSNSLNSWYPPT
jgi:hypothetical protein